MWFWEGLVPHVPWSNSILRLFWIFVKTLSTFCNSRKSDFFTEFLFLPNVYIQGCLAFLFLAICEFQGVMLKTFPVIFLNFLLHLDIDWTTLPNSPILVFYLCPCVHNRRYNLWEFSEKLRNFRSHKRKLSN